MGSRNVNRLRPLAQVASVLVLVAAVNVYVRLRSEPASTLPPLPPPQPARVEADPVPQVVVRAQASVPEPSREAEKSIAAPAPPPLDRAAVARAEASLDEASRDRAAPRPAPPRPPGSSRQPSTRPRSTPPRRASSPCESAIPRPRFPRWPRGGFIRADLQKLKGELTALRSLPRPKATSILTKSPVARPTSSDEFHFELRRGRISYIDLERLLELAKSDAQVRIRMSDRSGLITSQVGPVRSFSLAYVLGRANAGIDELIERQSIRFDLKGWELVPESEQRGETYEATRNPISEYTRAVNRLTPGRSVVTFWVYPDSFPLYRRLREELVSRGFSVAGRPLPEGMSIRGSPMGSMSAAQ